MPTKKKRHQPHIATQIELVALDRFRPYETNPKEHPPEQIETLAKIIQEYGFLVPVLWSPQTGELVAGHGRHRAAEWLKLPHIPAVSAEHLTPDQIAAFRLADNRIAQSGNDPALLAAELQALQQAQFNLALTAYTPEEIERFLDQSAQLTAEYLAEQITTEEEHDPEQLDPAKQAERAAELLRQLAQRNPDDFAKAKAIVLPTEGSKDCLVLTDPGTVDAISELRRYHDEGKERSPLAALFRSIAPLNPRLRLVIMCDPDAGEFAKHRWPKYELTDSPETLADALRRVTNAIYVPKQPAQAALKRSIKKAQAAGYHVSLYALGTTPYKHIKLYAALAAAQLADTAATITEDPTDNPTHTSKRPQAHYHLLTKPVLLTEIRPHLGTAANAWAFGPSGDYEAFRAWKAAPHQHQEHTARMATDLAELIGRTFNGWRDFVLTTPPPGVSAARPDYPAEIMARATATKLRTKYRRIFAIPDKAKAGHHPKQSLENEARNGPAKIATQPKGPVIIVDDACTSGATGRRSLDALEGRPAWFFAWLRMGGR